MRLLITGGAGFIGSSLAVALAERHSDWELLAADNLYRPGSELNLPRLERSGVSFRQIDVRERAALEGLGQFDAIVEAAAEPAVGADRKPGGRELMVDTNLGGAHNCLELAARSGAHFIALSSSRVYPLAPLRELALVERVDRFELAGEQQVEGVSELGISEAFPLAGARTLYGASKLAAELLAREYEESVGVPVTVNRCGVVAGPWQMATSDQGVFAHWALSFCLNRELSYIGWGGEGLQVRDVLHVDDLVDLLEAQLLDPGHWSGVTVNVGGGTEVSLSLREATALCSELTGKDPRIGSDPETRPGDIPFYVSDCSRLHALTDWRPQRNAREVIADTIEWIGSERSLASVL